MNNKNLKGQQKLVYEIIKHSKTLGFQYVKTSQILEEARNTTLNRFSGVHYKSEENWDQLKSKIEQTIRILKQKGYIKNFREKKGFWTITSTKEKYKPILCKALTIKNGRKNYCPIKKVFIGNPSEQCELIHTTDWGFGTQTARPMQACYFDHKPTKDEISTMQHIVNKERKQQDTEYIKLTKLRG